MVLQANNGAYFCEIGEILEKGDEEEKIVGYGPEKYVGAKIPPCAYCTRNEGELWC